VGTALNDKVVVIAGASAGVGLATAERFADEGARVVMLARRKDRLDEAVSQVGAGAVAVVADIADPDGVRSAFAEIESRFGRVDMLLNVAGVARTRLIEEATDEDITTVVGANFLGPIYTTRSAIPLMRKVGAGEIVNVSSEITLDDMPLMTLYSATKRGLDGFSRTMTKELRGQGIRVSLVVLGTVAPTSFGDNLPEKDLARAYPAWEEDGYLTRVAGKVPMAPDMVADSLLFVVTRPPELMIDVIHVRAAK
jgi:NAD(P)-dependent dehydrogenase (short-subunit alcohol dehydrogenase family)